jgi:4-hydroxy-tetrahydrodipicolinate reductase
MFFFEKKNQKTFASLKASWAEVRDSEQTFFASFFQKRRPFFLPLLSARSFSMKIGVLGLNGRMGRLVAEEVDASEAERVLSDSVEALAAASEAVIDFTHADAVQRHAAAFLASGCAWVLGTTGLDAAGQEAVFHAAGGIAVVQAANFSPGVNLVLAIAERLAAALPAEEYDAEIVEMHHRQKVDAPSGTALALGRAVAAGRGVELAEVSQTGRDGHTGPRAPGAIGFAALRGGQVVGEHTLLFASGTEHIALTHRAFDRRVFARGALRAAFWTKGRPPGLYAMMDVLGMTKGA